MSVIPALVNAIFILDSTGEYVLYEGEIENGYTKVSITVNSAQGYNIRYYKVKQIIAIEGQKTIKQSFEIPSQEFAYRMIERSILDKGIGENDGEIPVVITGKQIRNNSSDKARVTENSYKPTNSDIGNNTYKSALSSQSGSITKSLQSGIDPSAEIFGGTSFNEISSVTGTESLSEEFSGVKIANASSFNYGSNSTRNGNKAKTYSSLESALDSGF